MEREDSFEPIVAKAVYEVNRKPVALPQQRKITAFSCDFYRCAGSTAPRKITASQPHDRVDLFLWRGRRLRGPDRWEQHFQFAHLNENYSLAHLYLAASSEKSVGHRYAPMGAGSSARAAR